MALNPPLVESGIPARVDREMIILKRKDIDAEIKVAGGAKYKGSGYLYLTTCRLVFVNKKRSDFRSFDIPIALMSGEKFNQPIFGANNISGSVQPLYNLLPGPAKFKFAFMSGGTGTFLPSFYGVTEQIRRRMRSGQRGPDPQLVQTVASGRFQNVAYVDPNDPSTIFVQQPSAPPLDLRDDYYFPSGPSAPPPPQIAQPPPAPQPRQPYPAPSYPAQPPPSQFPQPHEYPPPPSGPQYGMPGQYPAPPGQYPAPPGQYAPPPGQYAPPPGQYAPPPGQYAPPSGQYAPPPGQYAPPPGQYPAPPGQHSAQPRGYPPPY